MLLKTLCAYVQTQYKNASQTEIEDVCMATVHLFPSLKSEDSNIGGIVCMNFLLTRESSTNKYFLIILGFAVQCAIKKGMAV